MQLSGSVRTLFLCSTVACICACGSDGITRTENPPAPNLITLASDAGDPIGEGRNYTYTQANSVISAGAFGEGFSMLIIGDEHWYGEFQLPDPHRRVATGHYGGVTGWPRLIGEEALPAMLWYNDDRTCSTVGGSFTIEHVKYSGDTLKAIDLSFVQHCEAGAPALHGQIHWHDADETVPPGPVQPIPASVWAPAPGAVPASGTVVYLTSDPGDPILDGATLTYTPAEASIHASASATGVRVSMDTGTSWDFRFEVMSSIPAPAAGYYAGVRRTPDHNPAKGGLNVSGAGRSCNALTGWFAIEQIGYTAGVLTSLTLRFEQHCEGAAAALRGYVRWTG